MTGSDSAIATLKEGCVHEVAIRPLQPDERDLSDTKLADRIVAEVGCKPIGDSWRPITSPDLEDYARRGFSFDLAYTTCRIDEDDRAHQLADLIFAQFDRGRRCLVNVSDNPWTSKGYSSTPTTDWTFDMTIVTIDSNKVGVLCFTAED